MKNYFKIFMLVLILVMDFGWFYFTGGIPSQIEGLILVNIIIICVILILDELKEETKEGIK